MLVTLVLLAQLVVSNKAFPAVPPPAPQVELAPATGRIELKWHTISLVGTVPANGDSDQYADTDETLDITLTLVNKTGLALTDFVATLTTPNTDAIECIDPYQVTIPSIAAGATFTTPAFRFKVGNASTVNRTSVDQILAATFDVAIHTAQFALLDRPMRFTLPLDLDASPNGGLSTYLQDFETGFGSFIQQTLDAGKTSLALSDGMRCQYNDPDIPGGNEYCHPGFLGDAPAGVNDWHVHDSSSANGGVGRAYTGSNSLHWGVHPGATPKRDTTRLKQLDAIKSGQINVPAASLHPELFFAHQISLMRDGNGGIDGAVDRAVVQVNVLNAGGLDGPVWTTIEPYVNRYDQQPYYFYSNCSFDPTDDGNDEDDFYPGEAPPYGTGPSSTCSPQYIFSNVGDTDYHLPADPARIGGASDGPGLTGSINVGTWIESRFNLQEFAGRRVKIRFLATTMEVGNTTTWDGYFAQDDLVADDGWYIDDVRVSPAANLAYTVSADTKAITALPCVACTSIQASLVATPNMVPEPGETVTLDASALVDHCKHSPPQYEFWIDENVNGVAGDAGDTLLRVAADEPTFVFTPDQSEQYAVVTSCRGEPTCDAVDGSNTAAAAVTVNCPPGIDRTAFGQTIRLWGADQGEWTFVAIEWPVAKPVDVIRGCLTGTPNSPATACLHESGSFTGSLETCLFQYSNNYPRNYAEDFAPAAGSYYYLVRGNAATCGTSGPGFTTHAASERPGRDTEIEADAVPGTCP